MRQDSRSLLSHLVRFLPAGIGLWFLMLTHQSWRWNSAPGRDFFASIAYLNCVLITLAGVSFFATAITEEKEQRALGLLRMADMNPVSILLGKSTPRMLAAALLLLVQVPFTLLAITLGGVMLNQVVATYVTLLAHIAFLANLALVFSVICDRSGTANRVMVVWCVVLYLIPEIVLISAAPVPSWLITALGHVRDASAFHRLREVLSTGFAESPLGYQVQVNMAGAVVLFLIAWALFDRFGHDEEGQRGAARGRWWSMSAAIRAFGTRRAWANALAWKDFHYLSGGVRLVIARTILYGGLCLALTVYSTVSSSYRQPLEIFGTVTLSVMSMAGCMELAVVASRIFLYEYRERTLSTLLMLPKTTAAIGWAKLGGCLLALVPVAGWLLVGALFAPEAFGDFLENALTEPGGWFAIAQIVLFAHVVALFSLFVSWGALPLTIGTFVFGYACCAYSLSSGPGDEDALFFMLAMGSWVCVAGVQLAIGERLRHLAARQ
jgi:ABC-type Na+ efflux pump permease subunit